MQWFIPKDRGVPGVPRPLKLVSVVCTVPRPPPASPACCTRPGSSEPWSADQPTRTAMITFMFCSSDHKQQLQVEVKLHVVIDLLYIPAVLASTPSFGL